MGETQTSGNSLTVRELGVEVAKRLEDLAGYNCVLSIKDDDGEYTVISFSDRTNFDMVEFLRQAADSVKEIGFVESEELVVKKYNRKSHRRSK